MKKNKILSLALAVILTAMSFVVPVNATTVSKDQAVSWAYSKLGKSLDIDGNGYWCVDLIYYYYQYLGQSVFWGNASDFIYGNAVPSGWQRIKITDGVIPQPGDIAVWKTNHYCNTCTTGSAGHIGIVTSANYDNFTAVNQRYVHQEFCTENLFPNTALDCVIRPNFSSSTSSVMTLSGLNYPIHKQSGYSFETFGVISSQNVILVGEAVVYDSSWNQMFGIGTYEEHGRTTLDINNFDSYMTFASLPDGQYYYKIYAIDAKGYEIEKVFSFNVGAGSTTSSTAPTITASHKHDTDLDSRYTWDNGVITKQPTCTNGGTKLYTCNECKATKTSSIPALGHDYSSSWTVDTEATCSSAGSKSQHCTRCDAKTNITSIPASGHNYGNWVTVTSASCSASGSAKRTCSCGASETKTLPASEHDYVNGKCRSCGKLIGNGGTLTVESKTARIGDKVSLDVVLKNNPGINAMSLTPLYDQSVLRLDAIIAGNGIWSDCYIGTSYVWTNLGSDLTDNGTVLTLEFTVLDTAPLANTTVSVLFDGSNDYEESPVIDVISGIVSVVPDTVYGDVNNDGNVNSKDLTRLMKYLAGISVEVFSPDLTEDGSVNTRDLTRLMKLIATA